MLKRLTCICRRRRLAHLRKVRKQTAILMRLLKDYDDANPHFKPSAHLSVALREASCTHDAVMRARYFHYTTKSKEREEWST